MNTGVMPLVDFGCYGGALSYTFDNVFVWDNLNSSMLDPQIDEEAEALELIKEKYDGRDVFFNQVQRLAPEYIQQSLDEYGIDAKVVPNSCKWYHPSQYNFSDDEMNFTLQVNSAWVYDMLDQLQNDSSFIKFMKSEYSSRSGFISFMPDSVEELNRMLDLEHETNNDAFWKATAIIITYLISEDPSIANDVTEEMVEYINGNSDYITLGELGIY